jgi:hypothetical protein
MGPIAGLDVLEKGEIFFSWRDSNHDSSDVHPVRSYCTDQAILTVKLHRYFAILGEGNSNIGVGVLNSNCLYFSQYSVKVSFWALAPSLEKPANNLHAWHIT